MDETKPLVSISCITFNHASYIEQALQGFLSQKCSFKFEVLIHDDASTDGTEEIIRTYEKKYPEIIKPIYEKTNQWVLDRRGSVVFNFPRAQGKYIALCEGDDYWTDPNKLQKQVDFLENNEGCAGTFHVCNTTRNNKIVKTSKQVHEKIDTVEKLFKNWREVNTLSLVFLNHENLVPKAALENIRAGDLLMCTFLIPLGYLHSLPDNMGCYRKHEGGVSNQYEIKNEMLFKTTNISFLLELLTDERFKKDWFFIKSYIRTLIFEFEDNLIEFNGIIKNTPKTLKGFLKSKIKKIF